MTAQAGALVLIKVGDGGSPETFTTVGGLRTSSITLGNQALDSSTVESGAWRQLLGGAGVREVAISGGGMFTDASSEEMVRGYAFAGTANNYRFVFANGDYLSGPFLMTHYSRSGNVDSEEIYALTLESAGTIVFTNI